MVFSIYAKIQFLPLVLVSLCQAVMFGGTTSLGEIFKAHILYLPTMVSHLWVVIVSISYSNTKYNSIINRQVSDDPR